MKGTSRSISLSLTLRESSMMIHESIKRFVTAALLILIVLLAGTFGYMALEDWSFLDSFYMTVITIATVGYREIGPLSMQGRVFTVFLIFGGIGVGGYALGTIAAFLIEGQMLDILRGRRMAKEITGLKNHIIICGFGKIGREVCKCLAAEGKDFIVIDQDPERVDEALALGYLAAVGEATDDEILERAGIRSAEGLVSAISDDSANVYLVLTARALNDRIRIIARGVGEQSRKKMLRAGADKVVSPFEIGARRMTALMIRPEIVDFLDAFSPGTAFGLRLETMIIKKSSSLAGKRLDKSYIKRDTNGALVIGIQKPGQSIVINPPGHTVLEAGDELVVLGSDEQLQLLRDLLK